MDAQAFWDNKHRTKYAKADWVNKPSLFAEWAVQYFPAGGTVLELGAGFGQDSRYFDSRDFKVTATDFSPEALRQAKPKSPAGIAFQQVDLSQSLPFANQSFDVVYAHLSLHYFDHATTERLFAEIHRVLKPGGVLAALCNSTSDPQASEGEALEGPDYRAVANLPKRFFSPESARAFAKDFTVLIADDQGSTYKDQAKGVANLIRLIARKES